MYLKKEYTVLASGPIEIWIYRQLSGRDCFLDIFSLNLKHDDFIFILKNSWNEKEFVDELKMALNKINLYVSM